MVMRWGGWIGRARRSALLGGAALLALALAGPAGAASRAVSIDGFAYDPDPLTIEVGDTVTWTNDDAIAHTVTADDGAFDSGSLAGDATFERTFATAGTFAYHCTVHEAMTGTIVVRAAADGGASPPNSATAAPAPRQAADPLLLWLGSIGVGLRRTPRPRAARLTG
jgi:plastocyanin